MTRIVAGFAGSLALGVPKSGTRPTSDRVREAIFSALEARDAIAGARVLDLYAGSGALGLEAASRGAASVVLVERNAAAAAVCRRNATAVRRAAPPASAPTIEVRTSSVQAYLEAGSVAAAGGTDGAMTPVDPALVDPALVDPALVDLALIDPPYDLDEAELARALAALAPLLRPDAIVLVERSTRSPEPAWPATITLDRRRAYGETALWWATA